jgi:putative alpha-1,2-mannosidase
VGEGKTFTILADGVSQEKPYVSKVILNGKELTRNYLNHEDIMHGGKIEFIMSEKPNKSLWTNRDACPPPVSSLD